MDVALWPETCLNLLPFCGPTSVLGSYYYTPPPPPLSLSLSGPLLLPSPSPPLKGICPRTSPHSWHLCNSQIAAPAKICCRNIISERFGNFTSNRLLRLQQQLEGSRLNSSGAPRLQLKYSLLLRSPCDKDHLIPRVGVLRALSEDDIKSLLNSFLTYTDSWAIVLPPFSMCSPPSIFPLEQFAKTPALKAFFFFCRQYIKRRNVQCVAFELTLSASFVLGAVSSIGFPLWKLCSAC